MKYIASNSLKQAPNEEIFALFPAEQARVAELRAQGILVNLYIAADYSKAWLICEGDSQEAVEKALESLPLHRFLNVEVTPLAAEIR
jgi:muconolactone delta-isomerase